MVGEKAIRIKQTEAIREENQGRMVSPKQEKRNSKKGVVMIHNIAKKSRRVNFALNFKQQKGN